MREYDFYIVPTPIGNLGDITNRAIEVLKSVDIIACEDSRNTQKLLNHFSIGTKCVSYHKFNERERVEYFIKLIKEGNKIALVSDAGTPLFCDPGAILVRELKKENIRVTSLPGANAVVTFLSQIPRDEEEFCFIGFLPKSETQITDILYAHKNIDTVFYESPNRLKDTLNIISEVFPGRMVSVGRELTKVFEEVLTDTVENLSEYFSDKEIKGEIVTLVHKSSEHAEIREYDDKIKALRNKKYSDKDISVILSTLYDLNKNEVYGYLISGKNN
ncbi:16S rRNA (cytidine(1402)-2'-O)-methyltransferase [bacterium]|nr:16S rRNA (cytidine(1402)-2'-O)-methyltransferase [bacterium]